MHKSLNVDAVAYSTAVDTIRLAIWGETLRPTIIDVRKAIVDRLTRSMGGDFVVVGAPDHPLVMRSVDIIVGGRAGLTAIMAMTAKSSAAKNISQRE